MIINRFENSQIKNSKLPFSWQSQNALDELSDFLQQNWEQRSVFYDDSTITSLQQFLGFTGQKGIRTKNYIGTIVFNGEQLNIFPKMFREDIDDHETEDLSLKRTIPVLPASLAVSLYIVSPGKRHGKDTAGVPHEARLF